MSKERVYDKQISPLMAEIIKVCLESKIAMLCSFSLPSEDNPDLQCTTALLTDEFDPPVELVEALNTVRSPRHLYATFTISKKSVKTTKLT